MQEIGAWVTAEGSRPAVLETAGDDAFAQELPGWLGSALQGALAGAATGAAAGPYGALIGAAAGGALGAASSAAAPPPTPAGASGAGAGKPAAGDAARANAIQALQQLAAAVPTLVQLLQAPPQKAKEGSFDEAAVDGNGAYEIAGSYWSVP